MLIRLRECALALCMSKVSPSSLRALPCMFSTVRWLLCALPTELHSRCIVRLLMHAMSVLHARFTLHGRAGRRHMRALHWPPGPSGILTVVCMPSRFSTLHTLCLCPARCGEHSLPWLRFCLHYTCPKPCACMWRGLDASVRKDVCLVCVCQPAGQGLYAHCCLATLLAGQCHLAARVSC